ncbi:ribosomal protein S18 acetylase RimI-like enzyme [Bacillus pakistanensis]|uniref:Ribosomal protein S18 acetylase RimI-like enzyme n=1 Tax=Rossellomorea pakistanensis TaxID=992288 RepID=A0ABS2NGV0_9BACI|nr:GNAT family N-acetyltransferase [Bacillus pakistanensis]MBM7587054.1 ribosomal protein S18 acetylase RimI-like enzyme [Bacillus pakistanensis]
MIQLERMGQRDFYNYLEFMVPEYARSISANFNLPFEKAKVESEELLEKLFPDGLHTKDQYIYNVYDSSENKKVGVLWYKIKKEMSQAFLYHIYINEESRGKGYGSAVLEELERKAKEHEVTSLALNVFGNNERAYELYKKFGYETSSIAMKKSL